MIRRMTDKLGHFAHGHQKSLQQQQPAPGLPLPVTTHTHLKHRSSISTQRTSERSKCGESVDEARPIDESNFPYQRRAKSPTLSFNAHGTGSFGRVHFGRPAFWPSLSCSLWTTLLILCVCAGLISRRLGKETTVLGVVNGDQTTKGGLAVAMRGAADAVILVISQGPGLGT